MISRPLLIDTHVLIWWQFDTARLSEKFRQAMSAAEETDGLAISIITFWEIALLMQANRLAFDINLHDWFLSLTEDDRFKIIPLDYRIIIDSTRLGPAFHRDPADQLIVATARCHQLSLLTADRKILNSGVVALAVT